MELSKIEKRTVTLELTPEECRRLAVCCKEMASYLVACGVDVEAFGLPIDGAGKLEAWHVAMYFESTACMFESSALAAISGEFLSSQDARNKLSLAGMRDGLVGDRIW